MPELDDAFRARWSFLAGKRVEFDGALREVDPDAEYVFYELSPGRVLLVAKDALAKVLAEVAPEEVRLRNVPLPGGLVGVATLAHPLKVLGYALGEELVAARGLDEGGA